MERRETAVYSNDNIHRVDDADSNIGIVEDRLNQLLALNRTIAEEKALYCDDLERREAEIMSKPVPIEKAFAYLGLMLGALPPSAIFFNILTDISVWRPGMELIFVLAFAANLTAAVVGFASGKNIAEAVRHLHTVPLFRSIVVLPFVGMLWGMVAGAAGGVFLFIIGAFFGAAIGGTVGAVALPAFAILHKLLKRGDVIELKHFLPISLGLTLVICAFILGL
jgi:hypothetical protein